jgi:hypothetical protein
MFLLGDWSLLSKNAHMFCQKQPLLPKFDCEESLGLALVNQCIAIQPQSVTTNTVTPPNSNVIPTQNHYIE